MFKKFTAVDNNTRETSTESTAEPQATKNDSGCGITQAGRSSMVEELEIEQDESSSTVSSCSMEVQTILRGCNPTPFIDSQSSRQDSESTSNASDEPMMSGNEYILPGSPPSKKRKEILTANWISDSSIYREIGSSSHLMNLGSSSTNKFDYKNEYLGTDIIKKKRDDFNETPVVSSAEISVEEILNDVSVPSLLSTIPDSPENDRGGEGKVAESGVYYEDKNYE